MERNLGLDTVAISAPIEVVAEVGDQVPFDFEAVLVRPSDPVEPALEAAEPLEDQQEEAEQPKETFGTWLLAQQTRKGWVGDLAKAAKADRAFPKRGSPDDVRKRLQEMGAEGDVYEALDDAELDWSGL